MYKQANQTVLRVANLLNIHTEPQQVGRVLWWSCLQMPLRADRFCQSKGTFCKITCIVSAVNDQSRKSGSAGNLTGEETPCMPKAVGKGVSHA